MRWTLPLLALVALGCGGHDHLRRHHRHVRVPPPIATARETVFPPKRPQHLPTRLHPRRPNIVFVLTDDLSDDLLRYLPAARQLAREGTSFKRYFVSDSLCCPSRASIFTGEYPHNTGVFTNITPDGGIHAWIHNHDARKSFALALQARGYRTALFGKYLNGYHAERGYVPHGWSDWDATAEGYHEFDYVLNDDGHPTFYGNAPQDYLTDVIANRGADFIDRSARGGEPFFLELATFAPHRPAVSAPRDHGRYPYAHAPRTSAFNRQVVDAPRWLVDRRPLSPGRIAFIDQAYRRRARCMGAVNRMLALIEQRLRATGQLRDTYIVFSSDNGYHMGQHRLLPGKLTAFDTDIRVPLIVDGPHVPRRQVQAIAQNVDLAPTFDRLAGVTPPLDVDGRSLVGWLHGRQARHWRRAALVEHHRPIHSELDPDLQGGESGTPPTYAALRTRWSTYVEYLNGDREFYDDRSDPAQLRNEYVRLSLGRRIRLHRALMRLLHCHGARQCSVRPSRGGSSR